MSNLCQLLLAGVFVLAGFQKAIEPQTARAFVESFWPGGGQLVSVLGLIDIVLSAWLISSFQRSASLVCAGAILVLYSVGLSWARSQGAVGDCGCFGKLFASTTGAAILRNCGLLFVVTVGLLTLNEETNKKGC